MRFSMLAMAARKGTIASRTIFALSFIVEGTADRLRGIT